jgi:hypothetical protein
LGHFDQFPPTNLSVGYLFGEESFAAVIRSGQDAPKADLLTPCRYTSSYALGSANAISSHSIRSWRKPISLARPLVKQRSAKRCINAHQSGLGLFDEVHIQLVGGFLPRVGNHSLPWAVSPDNPGAQMRGIDPDLVVATLSWLWQ